MTKLLKRVFGCWHLKMSLPFSGPKETYRTCIDCGARRRFDPDLWATGGPYYYPDRPRTLHEGVHRKQPWRRECKRNRNSH